MDSGLWLPGLPGDTETPAAADLAVAFSNSDPTFYGSAAFRESIFNLSFYPATLVDLGGGVQSFAPNQITYQFATGLLQYDLGLEDVSGFTALDTFLAWTQNDAVGTYENLGGGMTRVTLPFAFDLIVADFQIGSPVPTLVTMSLSGEIVATAIPEPGTALLLGLGGVGLAVCGRRRVRRTRKEAE